MKRVAVILVTLVGGLVGADDDDYGRDCDAEGEQFQKEVRACLDGATTLDAAKLCWQP